MWNISAEPMPSRISTPKLSIQRRYSSGGSASPAESTSRSDDRSRSCAAGVVQHPADHRRHRRQDRRLVALDHVEQRRRLAALAEQRRGAAHREREQQVGPGRVAEEQLGHRDRQVALADAQHLLRVALGVPGQVLLKVDRGLRLAGRAAGEEPDRRIVAMRVGVREARRRPSRQLRRRRHGGRSRRRRSGASGGGTNRAADPGGPGSSRPRSRPWPACTRSSARSPRRAAAGSPSRSRRRPWPRRTRRRRTRAGPAGSAAPGPRSRPRASAARSRRGSSAPALRDRCRPRRASRGRPCRRALPRGCGRGSTTPC